MSQRVLLVGVVRSGRERWRKIEALEELAALSKTSGGTVVEKLIQVRPRLEPATLIGKGKALEIKSLCNTHNIDLVIFDDELTPTQLRNLEEIIGVRVIDRSAVILDIFAIHARTAEAKAQVELAQLEYLKTRLTGLGVKMSRLGGGIGTRGPGETKLEVDRRRIEQRIHTLRQELLRIDRERQVQRKWRNHVLKVALVGYTNAGKSTLFNRLTKARAKISDELFATLDANSKILSLDRNVRVILTDTVGFIRNLPAQLIATFRSTLGEISDADLILLVADASANQISEQIDTVLETLTAIGAYGKPILLVFNKIDRVFDEAILLRLKAHYSDVLSCNFQPPKGLNSACANHQPTAKMSPKLALRSFPPGENVVFISALTGSGIEELIQRLRSFVERYMVTRTFTVPSHRWDLITKIINSGQVLSNKEVNGNRRLRVRGFPIQLAQLRKYLKVAGKEGLRE